MSTTTTNYSLIKPELTDAADITAMNENWDKIDETLEDKVNKSGSTMSGELTIKSINPAYKLKDTNRGDECLMSVYNNNFQIKKRNVDGDDSNYRRIIFTDSTSNSDLNNALMLGDKVNGVETYHNIIHAGNLAYYMGVVTASLE